MDIATKTGANGRPIWFPAKRYGWGWGPPVAWQGWVAMASYVIVMAIDGFLLAGRNWVGFYAVVSVASALLIVVCYLRGEPPRWRWGN